MRFKADDGSDFPEWEKKTLGDVATIVMGQSPDSKHYHEEPVGKVLVQGNADLKDGKVFPRIWTTESPKSAEPGALLMTVRAPVGALAITDIPVALGRGVCAIEGPSILYYLLSKVETEHYWDKVSAGSTFSAVDSSSVNSLKITLPTPAEQERILSLLSTVDSTVALCQRKIDLLTQSKKALMQQIFSQKLRFKADDGSDFPEWEEHPLFDLLSKIVDFRGRTPKKLGMDWSAEPTDYLALSALNVKMGYIDMSVDPHYGNNKLYSKWMAGNELYPGEVIFTTEAPMGNVAQIPDSRPYILSQRTIAFIPITSRLTDDFLACSLQSPQIQNQLKTLATGGTAQGVSQRSLEHVRIVLPSLPEQQKIASCLSSADALIDQARTELEQWQEVKKSLLQQMFV